MVLTFVNGTITSSTSEQTIFDITSDKNFATWIFCNTMIAGDIIEFKVYVKDQQAGVMRSYSTVQISGVQVDPSYFTPFVPTKEYKVTLRTVAGGSRAITWQRIEVT